MLVEKNMCVYTQINSQTLSLCSLTRLHTHTHAQAIGHVKGRGVGGGKKGRGGGSVHDTNEKVACSLHMLDIDHTIDWHIATCM